MKKLVVLFALWFTAVLAVPSCAYPEEVLSILYFENTTRSANHDWLRKGLADMLISDLAQVPTINVVEREALQKILKEQALGLTGAMDESQSIEVGKLLNAQKLVSGSYIVSGPKIRVDTKITDVTTGVITTGLGLSGTVKAIFDLEKQLAKQILDSLSLTAPLAIDVSETDSIEALKTYYQGVELFDAGQIQQAQSKFLRAKTLDPLYLKPQRGLEASYQFLKDFKKLRKQREIRKLYQFADQLKTRLATPGWKTYADIAREAPWAKMSPTQVKAFNERNNVYMQCDSPAQCTWRLMMTLWEIGAKAVEHFNDHELQKQMIHENERIAAKSRTMFKNDPFLAEILYVELLDLHGSTDYDKIKNLAEAFMQAYPDYRLIEFIEQKYEKTLDALSAQ